MAIRPCSFTLHRYPGAARSFYPSIVKGAERQSCKLLLCPKHMATQVDFYSTYLTEVSDDGDDSLYLDSVSCASCGEALEGDTAAVFVTGYVGQDARRDYYGVLHVKCIGAAQSWLGMNLPGAIVDNR